MLWFDVSIVQPATGTPLRLPEPAFVESPQTPEAPSLAPSPIAASDIAVTTRFAAENGKEFLADYKGLLRSLSRSTEPISPQPRQQVVVSSSIVGTDSHKTLVLEEESTTNRKAPVESGVDASKKLGDALTKAVTKPPMVPSELEAKSDQWPMGLVPKVEELDKTQASIQTQISKSAPLDLTPKLRELAKTPAGVSTEVHKGRHRSSSTFIGYGLAGFGGLSLILAVVFTSTVLAFIGLGLTFWGALLLFIRPRHYVRSDLMDSTALSSLTTIDRMITSLGYTQKGVYIPVDNAEKAVVFIPAQPLKKIPNLDLVGKQTFLKDPEGIAMVPPGLALANLFERELKVKFSDWSLQKMMEQLPKLLIENLEMVQDCTIKIDGDKVNFTFVESVYSEFCSRLRDSTKICSSLGCPMCSAMACVLAEVTHRPVEFDKDKYTTDGGTVESSYHLLPG